MQYGVETEPINSQVTSTAPTDASSACRTINVLFIIDHLTAIAGGGERALAMLARRLPKPMFRCSVITLKGEVHPDAAATLGCPIYPLHLGCSYGSNAVRTALRIRRIIRDNRIAIVHTFFESSNTWGGMVAKLAGVPVLVSSRRDMGILRGRKHHLGYRLINPWCDGVVAVSAEVRRWCIAEERIDPAKVVTVYNGIELESIDSVQPKASLAELGVADPEQVIVSVANVRHVKGVDVFARAAALVCREFPHANFLVIGACPGAPGEESIAEELRQLVTGLGIENNFKLVGIRHDVVAILKSSRVFCMLSRSEGFSNAILEAMACGLPSVVTRVGGNAEAINEGETGFLVASEDHQTAAQRLCALLRDPDRAATVGRAARVDVANRFSAERMSTDMAALYERLLSRKTRMPD